MTSMSVSPDRSLELSTIRRVSRRVIPLLGTCYFINFLDRSNIGFAQLAMGQDLLLSQTMFGLASGLFFLGYLVFEIPSNMALHKFGARRWIARIMMTWGLCAIAMGFVNGAASLYVVRVLLGLAEAGFFPGMILYLTMWLPRRYRARFLGLSMISAPLSLALGAPISTAVLQYADGLVGLAGWRLMFIAEGAPALVLAVLCWLFLTDRPAKATWLTDDQRCWLQGVIDREQAATKRKRNHWRALLDPRVLGLGLIYFGITYGSYALSFFLPTIVDGFSRQFGTTYTFLESGLIVAVPSLLAVTPMILWSRHSDRTGERMWHVVLPTTLVAITIPLALYMDSPFAVIVVVSLASIGLNCAIPVFWYLPPLFLTGGAAAVGVALINCLGAGLSGFTAPYITGWTADATGGFRPAMWLVSGCALFSAIGLLVLSRSAQGAELAASAFTHEPSAGSSQEGPFDSPTNEGELPGSPECRPSAESA